MRKLLFAATCLTPVTVLCFAGSAAADTTISTSTSTPIRTSTVNNGSADNVIVASGATLTPASGAAITIDSNNSATNNGTITVNDASNLTGIAASSGLSGTITNTGTITLGETTTATDKDGDGDLDGPFATTTNKFGIHVSGPGTFTGNIVNSGAMVVTGTNSGGIVVDGTLAGSLTNSSSVTVTGDGSYGIHLGAVTGSVNQLGTVSVQGLNGVGVALDGDVGGAVVLQGPITVTGYRYTTVPTDTSILDSDDLLQGGPAVRVSGNVAGGILLDVAPTASTTDTDVDKDGIPDANELNSAVTSYGGAPALLVGAADRNTSIGLVSGQTAGIVNRGTITGSGLYAGVNAVAVQLGGLDGGTLAVAGGLSNAGTIQATANTANASALLIGNGTSVPVITNSGTIGSTGTLGSTVAVRGIDIAAGATVGTVANSGTISASLAGTDTGVAAAIRDASGTLNTITNTGSIYGILTSSSTASLTNGYALDLGANTSGIAYTQSMSTADDAIAPALAGRIVTGSGNDSFAVSAGSVAGTANLGAGDDTVAVSGTGQWAADIDFGSGAAALTLANTASFTGDVTFGNGPASITLSDTSLFSGLITPGTGGLSVAINGGKFIPTNAGAINLSSLTVGATGEFAININGAAGTSSSYVVAGAADLASGAKVGLNIQSLLPTDRTFTVLTAGTLTGGAALAVDPASVPFLYTGMASSTGNTVSVTVARKSAAALGLNRAESDAFDETYNAIGRDSGLSNSFLAITDQDTFVRTYGQLLPDHAGGLFQSVTIGSRAVARAAADPEGIVRVPVGSGPVSVWLQEAAWHNRKGRDDTGYYRFDGNGFTGAAEIDLGQAGAAGLAASYIVNDVNEGFNHDKLFGYQYEGMAYWRGAWGGLHAAAHASFATITDHEDTSFAATYLDTTVSYANSAHWRSQLITGGGEVSYRAQLGAGFDATPKADFDYYHLKENSHSFDGDAATALSVDSRTSDEAAVTGGLTLGYGLGREGSASGWTRFEVEGGWRQVVGGKLGDTTARFTGGNDFTIGSDDLQNGYVVRARAIGGNASLRIVGEASGEEIQGQVAFAGRVSARLAF